MPTLLPWHICTLGQFNLIVVLNSCTFNAWGRFCAIATIIGPVRHVGASIALVKLACTSFNGNLQSGKSVMKCCGSSKLTPPMLHFVQTPLLHLTWTLAFRAVTKSAFWTRALLPHSLSTLRDPCNGHRCVTIVRKPGLLTGCAWCAVGQLA